MEELKLSRRNGTWPPRLAVRNSFWLSVKKSFSTAQLQKLYHALVGQLHARSAALETWKHIIFDKVPPWDESKLKILPVFFYNNFVHFVFLHG